MGKSKNKYLKGKKMMKRFLILLTMLLAMLFGCTQVNDDDHKSSNSNQQTNENQNQGSQNGENNSGNQNEDNKDDVVTTGKIVGKATYTNTANHAGIQVTLVSTDGIVAYNSQISSRSRSAVAVMKNVVTSESGEYSFDNVKEGVYTIYASSDDSTEKAVLTNVVVQSNQVVTAADLNLTATGSICGRVTLDSKEDENLGITVVIAGTSYMAVTDSFGFFIISDIPADKGYQVVIMKGDYCTIWSKVSVEAGKENNLGEKNITSQKNPTVSPNTDSFIWHGSFATSPANPEKYWAYFNTTDGCSYIYDGAQWTLLAQAGADGKDGTDGKDGIDGINGENGSSIVWKGALTVAPENPKECWAYYNTVDQTSYIWNGTDWDTLAVSAGGDTVVQVGINWLGSYNEVPANPSLGDAYYNSTLKASYLYDGSIWQQISKDGEDGKNGTNGKDGIDGIDGVTINWKGSSATSPENPEKYWAYFNTTEGCSYIYDGEKWTLLAQAGKDGENGTNGGGASVEHKITYELNGGTNNLENPNSFLEYLTVNLRSPTRAGYYFAGWYETADFSGNRIKGWEIGEKRNDVTLYAKWIEKAEADASGFGVYSYTLNIEDISTVWGGTTKSPSFSVILLTDEQLEVVVEANNLKVSSESMPEYQLGAYSNLSSDTAQTGNFGVYGIGYNFYTGVAATITGTTFTLTVDMAELDKTQLKALFAENDFMETERPITEDDMVDLWDYKPYVLALGTQEADSDNYTGASPWSGDLMKMTVGATFPTDLQYVTPTCYDLKYIYGGITESEQIELVDNSFAFVYTDDGWYGTDFYFSNGTYYFTYGGVTIDSLDTEIQLVENGSWSYFNDEVLTAGNMYKITLIVNGEDDAYVKVTEVQPESISITSTPYKTSYYVGEWLDLSGLEVQVVCSDDSKSAITVTDDMVSGFDSSVAGTQTLTVTYGDYTATFEVEVVE